MQKNEYLLLIQHIKINSVWLTNLKVRVKATDYSRKQQQKPNKQNQTKQTTTNVQRVWTDRPFYK